MRGFNMIRLTTLCVALAIAPSAHAQTIYPLNRAEILAGSRFDLKVEFPGSPPQGAVRVTINGKDATETVGKPAVFVEKEDGGEHSAYWIREVSLTAPGNYVVEATAGDKTAR
jgi:alkaline phosphatase